MSKLTCTEFETMLDGYREGILPAAEASVARAHVDGCEACAELVASTNEAVAMLAALPRLEMPEHVRKAIFDRTIRPRRGFGGGGLMQAWRAVSSPRFAMGLAMAVFAFSLIVNAAQVNLRDFSIRQLSPVRVAGNVQRDVSRSWGHVVAYYHDLRVVYEIQAALHQMRQEPASSPQAPTGHTQRLQPTPAARALAVGLPIATVFPLRQRRVA